MPQSFEDIESEARALPADERAKLVQSLLESLRGPPLPEVDAAWSQEIEERVAAFDRGEVAAYAAEGVFAEARRLSR